jgi:hypothetical protein
MKLLFVMMREEFEASLNSQQSSKKDSSCEEWKYLHKCQEFSFQDHHIISHYFHHHHH